LYNVTGGDAKIGGNSIVRNMRECRPLLGVCPQENVLWDFLTVHDHMQLFRTMRNVKFTADKKADAKTAEEEINDLLKQVDLYSKRDTIAKDLSGGMKRKLQLAVALIGDPKVVFLDEPTAGMDSKARRSVWKLLMNNRQGRCIVLCTHYMDEADILGDRVAVIDNGRLQEAGTPSELKTKYGKGMHLTVGTRDGADRRRILDLLAASGAQGAVLDVSDFSEEAVVVAQVTQQILDSDQAGDMDVVLPLSSDMPQVFEALGSNKEEYGIENYGIEATTLEDVFWELGQESDRKKAVAVGLGGGGHKKKVPKLSELVRGGGTSAFIRPPSSVKIATIMKRRTTVYLRAMFPGSSLYNVLVKGKNLFTVLTCSAFICVSVWLTTLNYLPSASQPGASIDIGPGSAFYQNQYTDSAKGVFGMPYYTEPGVSTSTTTAVIPHLMRWGNNPDNDKLPVPINATSSLPCFSAWLIGVQNNDNLCPAGTRPQSFPESHAGSYAGGLVFTKPTATNAGVLTGYCSFTGSCDGTPSAEPFCDGSQANCEGLCSTPTPGQWGAYSPGDFPNATAANADYSYTIRPDTSYTYSLPAAVSLINSAIYEDIANSNGDYSQGQGPGPGPGGISTSTSDRPRLQPRLKQFPKAPKTEEELQVERLVAAQISTITGTVPFVLGMLFLFSTMAYTVAEDNEKNIKQLQVLMGISPSEYWAAEILWDLIFFCIVMVLPVVVMFWLESPLGNPGVIVYLLLFFASWIPIIYSLASIFSKATTAQSMAFIIPMMFFFVTYIPYIIISIPGLDVVSSTTLDALRILFCFFPPCGLAFGLRAVILGNAYGYSPFAMTVDEETASQFNFLPVETGFWPMVIMLIVSLFIPMKLLIGQCPALNCMPVAITRFFDKCVLELGNKCTQILCRCVCIGRCYGKPLNEVALPREDVEDEDVARERKACDNDRKHIRPGGKTSASATLLDSNQQGSSGVHVHHLRKVYPPSGKQRWKGTTAVHDMCLRIRQNECFSLLGTNGAGKTTTLSMIMRQLVPTKGECFIEGEDIYRLSAEAHLGFGFCPQANALFDELTTAEMLAFYSTIRGVAVHELESFVESWLLACQLDAFRDTRCANLSGGNKRKVSLAIAIIGNPKLAVLDEPSAGVDPAARKRLHRIINGVKASGTTVIITTHHMSEAQKLGERIGIMVQGRLACLGSPQQLLARYSEGYVLTASMCKGCDVDLELLPTIQRLCPTHKVTDKPNQSYCSVLLGDCGNSSGGVVHFNLVEMYRAMEELKRDGKVEFFTCGQSNLESVFLKLSKLGEKAAEGGAIAGEDGKQWTKIMEVKGANCHKEGEGSRCFWPLALPEDLEERGLVQEDWDRVTELKEDGLRSHPFYTNMDMQDAYWCFPLLCLQPLLCLTLFRPLTYSLYGKYQKGKEEQVARLNDMLRSKGVGCTWPDTDAFKVKKTAFRDSMIFWDITERSAADTDYNVSLNSSGKLTTSTVLPEKSGRGSTYHAPGYNSALGAGGGAGAGGVNQSASTPQSTILEASANLNVRI